MGCEEGCPLAGSAEGLSTVSDLSSQVFQQWAEEGVFDKVIEALARDLQERGGIDMIECFIDGTFSLVKKGGYLWERLNRVKAPRSRQSRTLVVLFYLSRSNLQALMRSPVEKPLDDRFVDELPEKFIGDRAYNSDPLDERLAEMGVEIIAPHKHKRVKQKTQDDRKLRCYKCRWKVERFFA